MPDLQRRTLRVLMAAQLCAGAGLAAGVTVGALLAADVLRSEGLAGLPSALFTGGSAVTAVAIGRLSQRRGRRVGLASGYLAGAVGAVGVVWSAAVGAVPLLLLFLAVYGAGTATNLQARYAGADLAAPERRATAVSTVLVATTLGAVVGPNLVGVMGDAAAGWDLPRLTGPFVLAAGAYAASAVVIFAGLRPDPLLTARRLAADQIETRADDPAEPLPSGVPAATGDVDPVVTGSVGRVATEAAAGPVAAERITTDMASVRLGAAALVVTQAVMVAIMTMTPLHLRAHGHGLGDVGLVIALHVAAMYLPSPVTGRLVDRVGRRPMLLACAATLTGAGLVAAVAPPSSVAALAVALVLLGLGWNLGLVAGTAIVTDATPLATRARTQGTVDLCVALSGAAGGISSGAVVAVTTYATLALGGAALAVVLIPVALRARSVTETVSAA